MYFYVKVEYIDKLNSVIDRIYPNRSKMESSVNEDGIFIGRYVLVDYEQEATNPYIRLYKDADSMDFYFDINLINSASKTYDNKDKYTIAGIVSMLVFQQIWSLSMTIGLLPIMGITLPFISYGGSSLLSYMFLVGIIFNVSNQSLRYTN